MLADGEGTEHPSKTRGKRGFRSKAAQNPAHLAHGMALMTGFGGRHRRLADARRCGQGSHPGHDRDGGLTGEGVLARPGDAWAGPAMLASGIRGQRLSRQQGAARSTTANLMPTAGPRTITAAVIRSAAGVAAAGRKRV